MTSELPQVCRLCFGVSKTLLLVKNLSQKIMFLEHGIKVVKRVLEKRLYSIVSVDEMHFGFMPEGGKIDAVFMLRIQEEYHAK